MDRVRAKFQVGMVGQTAYGGQIVHAHAVMGRAHEETENQSFARATPAGKLEITVDNPDVKGFFEPGAEYYVTFEKAPKA